MQICQGIISLAYRFNYRIEVNNEKKKGNITIFIFNCIQRWRKKYIGININETDLDVMSGMGFTIPIIEGECLLPSPEYGKPFFDNAEGKITIHKDQKRKQHINIENGILRIGMVIGTQLLHLFRTKNIQELRNHH